MNGSERMLRTAAAAMMAALVSMVVCIVEPAPRTIGTFLGLGLPLGLAGIALYAVYVVRDLRRRRAL